MNDADRRRLAELRQDWEELQAAEQEAEEVYHRTQNAEANAWRLLEEERERLGLCSNLECEELAEPNWTLCPEHRRECEVEGCTEPKVREEGASVCAGHAEEIGKWRERMEERIR